MQKLTFHRNRVGIVTTYEFIPQTEGYCLKQEINTIATTIRKIDNLSFEEGQAKIRSLISDPSVQ